MKYNQKISAAVIRRLPRYHYHLDKLYQSGVPRISSSALGELTGLTASQIRQDLSCFGEFGQQGYGYNVESLRDEISNILGLNEGHTAVLLGAGRLGQALLSSFPFHRCGVNLTAVYDVSPKLVNTTIRGVPVYPISELEQRLSDEPVDIGVLTVPAYAATDTARQLADLKVKGIWNFTNIDLGLRRPGLVVENIHFSDSLLALSYMISEQ